LVNETRLADSFHDVYQTIPRTGDSANPPEATPQETMHRVAVLHTSHNELKNDMLEEVAKVEKLLIGPLSDCKVCGAFEAVVELHVDVNTQTVLKPVKKAIEKREHKKLDYERFQKAVESSKAKKVKTDRYHSYVSRLVIEQTDDRIRDYSAQSKNEAELEKATFVMSPLLLHGALSLTNHDFRPTGLQMAISETTSLLYSLRSLSSFHWLSKSRYRSSSPCYSTLIRPCTIMQMNTALLTRTAMSLCLNGRSSSYLLNNKLKRNLNSLPKERPSRCQ